MKKYAMSWKCTLNVEENLVRVSVALSYSERVSTVSKRVLKKLPSPEIPRRLCATKELQQLNTSLTRQVR